MRPSPFRMGPGKNDFLHVDPAYVKLEHLNKNRFRYFRWTPYTAKVTIMYTCVVPAIVYAIAYTTDGKYTFRGKMRGDPITNF